MASLKTGMSTIHQSYFLLMHIKSRQFFFLSTYCDICLTGSTGGLAAFIAAGRVCRIPEATAGDCGGTDDTAHLGRLGGHRHHQAWPPEEGANTIIFHMQYIIAFF